MKVLNVLHDERVGGPSNRVLSVARELRQYGIETIIVLPKGEKKFAENARNEGFKVYQVTMQIGDPKTFSGLIKNAKYVLTIPIVLYRLSRIIKREKVDIIHNNSSFNIAGFFAALINRVKLVWHLNDTLMPGILRSIMSPIIAKYSEVIVVASRQVDSYYFDYRNIKSFVIYPPIDIKKFANTEKSKNKLRKDFNPSSSIIVGCVGNVNPLKGLEYFIKSAALIKDYLSKDKKRINFLIVAVY